LGDSHTLLAQSVRDRSNDVFLYLRDQHGSFVRRQVLRVEQGSGHTLERPRGTFFREHFTAQAFFQAVVSRDGFNYVMQVKADNRVGLLKVQTGRRVGDQIEITQGLPDGVKLVTQGAGFLNEGDAVRVAP
jgi:hypothetical protein